MPAPVPSPRAKAAEDSSLRKRLIVLAVLAVLPAVAALGALGLQGTEVRAPLVDGLVAVCVVMVLAVTAASWAGELLIVRRVRRLARAAELVGHGDLFARSGARTRGGDEIDALGRMLDVIAQALEARQGEADRATDALFQSEAQLRRKVDQLRVTDQQRRELLAQAVKAQEDERARVAADIHDDSIQVMTAVGLRLERLRRRLRDPGQLDLLQDAQETVAKAVGRLRQLLLDLHPPSPDREGLAASIHRYLTVSFDGTGVTFHVRDLIGDEPPESTRLLLYRITQEAVNNVRKHDEASRVEVRLERRPGGYRVTITDDGKGLERRLAAEGSGSVRHLGLAAMRERTEQAGGWWRAESRPSTGTTVEAWVPGPTVGGVATAGPQIGAA